MGWIWKLTKNNGIFTKRVQHSASGETLNGKIHENIHTLIAFSFPDMPWCYLFFSPGTWHVTHDTLHVTCDTRHVSLKISAPFRLSISKDHQCLYFEIQVSIKKHTMKASIKGINIIAIFAKPQLFEIQDWNYKNNLSIWTKAEEITLMM